MTAIESLRAKLAQVAGDMAALTAAVQAESRPMNEDENKKFQTLDTEYGQIESSIKNFERAEAIAAQPLPSVVSSDVAHMRATTSTPITGTVVAHGFGNHGFAKGFGEQLLAVRAAATTGRVDPRLMVNAVTTWAGETVGADGGFALAPDFVQGIMSLVTPPDSFVRALNPLPTQSDLITIPKDEDAPWAATGVTAAKTAEGIAITASKIAVKQTKVVMHGIKSLVHVDEKSLRDMAFLAAYVQRKMGEKIRWKVENYIINGTGEGEPLGMLNAPGRHAVTAAAGTSTGTALSAFDLGLMEATALQGPGGFWICHPLIKAQIRNLNTGSGGYPLYQSDFRNGATVDTLLGYPCFCSPACKAYDTEGDIFFVKPDGYFLAFEASGIQSATTIAFAFDQNLQSFRSTLYMGGAPSLSAPVLLPDATNYQSNIVTLAGSRS
jgi:HK97 family phage major capsid protein